MNKESLLRKSFFSASCDARNDARTLTGDNLRSSMFIMHRIFAALGVYVVKKTNPDYHLNAMFGFDKTFELLGQAKKILEVSKPNETWKFLDVGCGFGNVVMIANEIGFEGFGLDVQKPYCDIARMLCPKENIIHKDAFQYSDYAKYDCIYFFNPTCQTVQFREYIKTQAKEGTVIIDAYSGLVSCVTH